MPSISDIPAQLQPIDHRPAFIEWLSRTPVAESTRREVAYLWSGMNETSFTHAEWLEIMKGALQG